MYSPLPQIASTAAGSVLVVRVTMHIRSLDHAPQIGFTQNMRILQNTDWHRSAGSLYLAVCLMVTIGCSYLSSVSSALTEAPHSWHICFTFTKTDKSGMVTCAVMTKKQTTSIVSYAPGCPALYYVVSYSPGRPQGAPPLAVRDGGGGKSGLCYHRDLEGGGPLRGLIS